LFIRCDSGKTVSHRWDVDGAMENMNVGRGQTRRKDAARKIVGFFL
jgi:hypothetical protein